MPSLEDLLRQGPWLRRLATGLCADPGAADDLVQNAWVAALRSPPRRQGSLRAWLARVLRNAGRQRGRSERARLLREQDCARPESQPPTLDVVARAETGRRLVALVMELPEPYRATVLLRYLDELSAEAIARQQGVPPSTVRTRVQRGLLLLRERLRREHGESWMAALVAVAWPSGVGLVPPTGAGCAGLMGVVAMSLVSKIVAAVVVIAAAAFLWMSWPTPDGAGLPATPLVAGEPAPRPPEDLGPARRVATSRPEPVASQAAAAAPASEPAEPSLAEIEALMTPVGPGTLEGVVLRGRARVGGATVRCWQSWAPLPRVPRAGLLTTTTNDLGEFRFTGLTTERYRVGADGPDGTHAETMVQVLTEQPSERVVLLLGSARIQGRVYDDEGRAIADAWVAASLDTTRRATRMGFATGRRTDAQGAFVLDSLPGGVYWLYVRLDGDNRPGVQPDSMEMLPELAIGETRTVDLGAPVRAAVWSGTVRARNGEPVAGPARIALTESTRGTYREAEYDAQGRFRVALRPGTWKVMVNVRTRWDHRLPAPTVTVATADLERDVELPGVRVAGVLIDQATGQVWSRTRPTVEVALHREGQGNLVHELDVWSDGRFVFDGLPAGTWLLSTRFVTFGNNARHPVPAPGVTDFRIHVLETDIEVPVRVPIPPP